MRPRQGMQVRVIASSIVLALTLSPFAAAEDAVPSTLSSSASQPSEDQLPDSPGTVQARPNPPREIAWAQADNSQVPAQTSSQEPNDATAPAAPDTSSEQSNAPQASTPQSTDSSNDQASDPVAQTPSQSSQPVAQPPAQSQPSQKQQTPREPVGTAAAETIQTTGVAASRPAGAALAPAKQRRVRSILIKVGALVGVGVAVGTTMALSQGSPSKPPGSH